MQFSLAILSLVAFVSATPLVQRQAPVALCQGTTGTTQCCATDILGLADLDCANPPSVPTSTSDFTAICAAKGQRARCCAIPILGQALICGAPVGSQ